MTEPNHLILLRSAAVDAGAHDPDVAAAVAVKIDNAAPTTPVAAGHDIEKLKMRKPGLFAEPEQPGTLHAAFEQQFGASPAHPNSSNVTFDAAFAAANGGGVLEP
jgi:hypothetical protein